MVRFLDCSRVSIRFRSNRWVISVYGLSTENDSRVYSCRFSQECLMVELDVALSR
jgi:hypothetical protein